VVTEDQQPPAKRTKVAAPFVPPENEERDGRIDKQGSGHGTGKQIEEVFWSSPPKIDFKSRSQTKLLADGHKAYKHRYEEGEGEKVHIPETFEDSDSDSDSFIVKVQQLTSMNDGQAGRSGEGESSKHICFVNEMVTDADVLLPTKVSEMTVYDVITKESNPDKLVTPMLIDEPIIISTTLSPEVFLPDDNIVNT
jgi:hypothetical protein